MREIKEELGVIECSIRKLKDYYPIPSLTSRAACPAQLLCFISLGGPDPREFRNYLIH